MKSLFDLIKTKQEIKGGVNSERSLLIQEFTERINNERDGKIILPISPKVIAIKLAHIPTQDLYTFLSLCKDYKNRQKSFSKYFWGALKVK